MDNTWTKTGDRTLSLEGLQTLKEIFKDPYWILAKAMPKGHPLDIKLS
jgi:hypothetical protein